MKSNDSGRESKRSILKRLQRGHGTVDAVQGLRRYVFVTVFARHLFELLASKFLIANLDMKPPKSFFACQQCGAQSQKWLGRCPDCGAWNSMVEETAGGGDAGAARRRRGHGWAQGRRLCGCRRRHLRAALAQESANSIVCSAAASCRDPWCCSAANPGLASRRCCCRRRRILPRVSGPVLYCSGEESEHQVKMRGERLGVAARAVVSAGRDVHRAADRRSRTPEACVAHRRLDSDGVLPEDSVGAGQREPGAAGGHGSAVYREGTQSADDPRRPRDEGRQPRGAQGARARRRHRAVFRGRAAPLRIASSAR